MEPSLHKGHKSLHYIIHFNCSHQEILKMAPVIDWIWEQHVWVLHLSAAALMMHEHWLVSHQTYLKSVVSAPHSQWSIIPVDIVENGESSVPLGAHNSMIWTETYHATSISIVVSLVFHWNTVTKAPVRFVQAILHYANLLSIITCHVYAPGTSSSAAAAGDCLSSMVSAVYVSCNFCALLCSCRARASPPTQSKTRSITMNNKNQYNMHFKNDKCMNLIALLPWSIFTLQRLPCCPMNYLIVCVKVSTKWTILHWTMDI